MKRGALWRDRGWGVGTEVEMSKRKSPRNGPERAPRRAPGPLPDPQAVAVRASGVRAGAMVLRCSETLSGAQRRHLRGLGHALPPVVQVGHQGLHAGLLLAVEDAVLDHELIKVRILETCPWERETVALWLHEATGTAVVQILGRSLLLYAPHPEKPRIRLPRTGVPTTAPA